MNRLKREYGADLDWLLPYPGDLHLLKNVQPVLMRLYYHSGLRELAQKAGYKGCNLTSLETCSHFKPTHCFLLEAFESVYLHAIDKYLAAKHVEVPSVDHLLRFLADTASSKHTAKLQVSFVLSDLGNYIMVWLSLHSSNRLLQMGIFKLMARLFHASGREYYCTWNCLQCI